MTKRSPIQGDNLSLPTTVDDITPRWLTAALAPATGGVDITKVDIVEIIWGTATKVRIEVTYSRTDRRALPPERLCVKGGFDERVRAAVGSAGDHGMRLEAAFFRDLAPRLDIAVPKAWFADSDDRQGVLIFDDLALGGEFGSPVKPWTPDLMELALRGLARMHAQSWKVRYPDVGWLTDGAEPVRQAARQLFSSQHCDAYFAAPENSNLPAAVEDRARNLRGYEALWAHDDRSDKCVTHGDAHLGNMYIDGSGEPVFLDWAGVSRCPWAYDVAYFLVGGLSVEDRRSAERDLLNSYLSALADDGGPELDGADAWDDYRRHCLHGLIWSVLPAAMQSPENVRAMSDRYVAAIVDHDPLSLLGV